MADMQTFISWFLTQLPDFLMAEPMCYFIGFAFAILTIRIIRDLVHIA